MYSNIKIKKVLYKDNFMAIYGYDTENKLNAYTVIGFGDGVSYCIKKGKYNICNGGNIWIGKGLSSIVYKIIK